MWIELILLSLIILALWNITKKPPNYPPGPWGLPLIGYFPWGFSSFNKKLDELRQKHGSIVSWRIGSRLLVVISDYNMVKETYQSQAFADRPRLHLLSLIDKPLGMISSNGTHWHNNRRFTLRQLRDLGMGKSKLVSAVQYEAMELVNVMKKQAGKQAKVPDALAPAVINVLWQMVASKRFELDDDEVIKFRHLMEEMQNNFTSLLLRDIFPWFESWFPEFIVDFITKKGIAMELSNKLEKTFMVYVNEHRATLDENNPRDFIDEYLIEMEKQKSDPDSTMSDEDLITCVADLFGAGLETTSTTIHWSIFALANFPEIQKKLQNEIDNALPNKNLVTLDDKLRLPYTEAFITEILRFSSLIDMGVPRTVTRDLKLGNYVIPKDSVVISTTEAIHNNTKYFASPKQINPERFINSEGKFEAPKEGFFPFGIGKRQCLGESLARMQLFIILTTMVQHLSFASPQNKPLDLTPLIMPIINRPNANQEIVITVR